MARVTTEDCVTEIPNRFELIMTAAQRARKIGSGAPITLPRDNDKNTVISLREIAEKTIDLDELQEDMVQSHQRVFETESDDVDLVDLINNESDEQDMMVNGMETLESSEDSYGDDTQTEAPTDDDILSALAGEV